MKYSKFNLHTILMLSLCISGTLTANESTKISEMHSEEAFLIRRIAEFWKDGDYDIVKSQITHFLAQFPGSLHRDYFHGILGDLYLYENDPKSALSYYQQIADEEILSKTVVNKLQALYALDQYEELANSARPFLFSKAAIVTIIFKSSAVLLEIKYSSKSDAFVAFLNL